MWKYIILFVIWFGVVFGQNIESDTSLKVHTDSFNKSLSIEIIGGTYFTFEHWMEYSGTTLPFSMWRGGGKITYQTTPNVVFSLAGSYSYTRDLGYMYTLEFLPPELKFSLSNASLIVYYKHTSYFIGAGIDISYVNLFYNSNSVIESDTTLNTIYLRPVVSGSVRSNIMPSLYICIQIESNFYHFIKIGSKSIHLGDILPSVGIGLGYTFNLER